ncbi:MAG TPA: class I SAM-dependent methyltransferase [Ramlibacter sp.]|nr:class I SAM-dependent methyltransferase [Ramlibacter sp.]
MTLMRMARRAVPSLAALSYNPVLKHVLSLGDIAPPLLFKEFRGLPPNYMRVRIGAGSRLFHNQVVYLNAARNFWYYMFERGLADLDSHIVDIGVGCGRYAHHLRDYDFKGDKFKGRYTGIDIDDEMLGWCKSHFDAGRFEFLKSTHTSAAYRNGSGGKGFYAIPLPDASADLVFSTSLYTHLLEEELRNYTQEAFRVLRPGRHMAMYVFCLDFPPPTFTTRHTFAHRMGPAAVESLANPEAAVAYESAYLLSLCRELGFREASIKTVKGEAQPLLLAMR